MGWGAEWSFIEGGSKLHLENEQGRLSFGTVLQLWRDDAAFGAFFSQTLRNLVVEAYFWECPPLDTQVLEQPFESVIIPSGALARMAQNRRAFGEQFFAADDVVTTFTNLGGDAQLVVPVPQATSDQFIHLARFLRSAPEAQQVALWRGVAEAMNVRLGNRPVYLSTSGLGVGWLHVRLDDRPKYYQHRPYRAATYWQS